MKKTVVGTMLLLFMFSFVFSFVIAEEAQAIECCIIQHPGCQATQGKPHDQLPYICLEQPNPDTPCYTYPYLCL